jgi:hypothetical protein
VISVIVFAGWRSLPLDMTIRTLLDSALLRPFVCVLALGALAACDEKKDAAPAAAQPKQEPAAEPADPAAEPADPAAKPEPVAAPGVKIVANFEEFNGVYDKSVAVVHDIGVEIFLARDCPALTCETFSDDGISMSKDVLLAACPKVFLAEVGIDGAKDLPVGEHKAEISLLGVAESATNAFATKKDNLPTVKITERAPQAFVGTITFGTEEEGEPSARGTFTAPICPHKD